MNTLDVGKKLVELCTAGKFADAIGQLYAPDIVSIEASAPPGGKQRMEGLAAVKEKNVWWEKNHKVHDCKVMGPWPNGDRFIVYFKLDVTPKVGPMSGKRFTMEETGLYTVKNGKVVQEEFFYSM
jgi:hypothetical protein